MAADPERFSALRGSRAKIEEIFGADLRSLAAFRIVLAAVVLMNLIGWSANLSAHYTDDGPVPRRVVLADLDPAQVSINLINGTFTGQALLFTITAMAALALAAGYRTRLANVIVWFMVISIQYRNPFVTNAGDELLRALLFWGIFLPLGACWSVDRARVTQPVRVARRVFSAATVALFLQIAFVYWFTVILKSAPEWRTDGTALYYALSAEHLTSSFGTYLTQFPTPLKILTFATLNLEAIGPFLLFSPFFTAQLRTWTVAAFMGLHAGIFLTMDIGTFPVLSAFCMVCFLPGRFWEGVLPAFRTALANLSRRLPHTAREAPARPGLAFWAPVHAWFNSWASMGHPAPAGAVAFPGGDLPGVPDGHAESLPVSAPVPSLVDEPAGLRALPVTNLVVVAFLLFTLLRNVVTVSDVRMPDALQPVGYLTGLNQRWGMFAPRPPVVTYWYVMPGILVDGRAVDLTSAVIHEDWTRAKAVSWERPAHLDEIFVSESWRKYLTSMRNDADLRRSFAAYVCRTWNADHDGQSELVSFEVVIVSERTLPDQGRADAKRTSVVTRTCD